MIRFNSDDFPRLISVQPTRSEEWGYSSAAFRAAVQELAWPQSELADMVSLVGHELYSNNPSVSWFAPRSSSVFKHWPDFSDSVRKEICLDRMEGPSDFVPTVPFRAFHGAAIQSHGNRVNSAPSGTLRFRTLTWPTVSLITVTASYSRFTPTPPWFYRRTWPWTDFLLNECVCPSI